MTYRELDRLKSRVRSTLFKASSNELIKEGTSLTKPHENPTEYISKFGEEELKKTWIKE